MSLDLASFGGAAVANVPAIIEAADAPDGTASTWFTVAADDPGIPAHHHALSNGSGRITFAAVPRGQWVRVKCPALGLNTRFAVPNQATYLLDPADFPAPTATTRAASGVDIRNYIDYVTDLDGWAPAIEAAIAANPGRKLIATAGTYTIKRTVYVLEPTDSIWLELEPGAVIQADYQDGETVFGMEAPYSSDYWMSLMFYFRSVACQSIRISGDGLIDLNQKCRLGMRIDNTVDAANRTDVYVDVPFKNGYGKIAEDPESNVGGCQVIGAFGVVDINANSTGHSREAGQSENFATTAVNTTADTITVNAAASLATGRPVIFGTTGTLPGGITSNTTVLYAVVVNSTTIKLASSRANAHAGTTIDLTSQGTGTHTLYWGSGWPQSRVVTGHMIGDSSSDTYQPQFSMIRNCRIEEITTEDATTHPFRSDCDGALFFIDEDDDGTKNLPRVAGLIRGVRFRNCAGRFVKARGNVLVEGCFGERAVAPIWHGWGGQQDWDGQTPDVRFVNCTTVYDTYGSNASPFNPAYHYCYAGKDSSSSAGYPSSPLISGCRIVNRVSPVYGRLYAMANVAIGTSGAIKSPIVRDLQMVGGATLFAVDCGGIGLTGQGYQDSLLVEGVRASHILTGVVARTSSEAGELRLTLRDVENHAVASTTWTASANLVTLASNASGAFQTGQLVRLTTTGALDGPEINEDYWWQRVSDTTGYLHKSWRSAIEGATPVTVGAGSGTHTIRTYTRQIFRNINYQDTTATPRVPAIGSSLVDGHNHGWYVPASGPSAGEGTGVMALNQAVALDGSAGVITIPSASAINPGTSDVSIGIAGTLIGLKARRGRLALMSKVAANVGPQLAVDASDRIILGIGNGSSITEYTSTEALTDFVTAYEKVRLLATLDRDGFATLYANDVQVGDPLNISAQSAQTLSSAGSLLVGSDGTFGLLDVDAFALFSGVVPLEAWTERGVPPEFQWGDFAAAYTANYSAGVDGATGTRLTSLTGAITHEGQSDCIKAVPNTDANTHYWDKASIMTVGRTYRVSLQYFIDSGQDLNGIKVTCDNGFSLPGSTGYLSTLGAWTSVEFDVVAGATGLRFYARSNGSVSYAGDGTEAFYIRALVVRPIGAVLYCSPLTLQSHIQWLDASSNRNHALLSNSGATPRVPRSDGVIRATIAASGNSELLGSGVNVLPANCVIERIVAKSAGTPNITIGNSSGGAEYVASVALSSAWTNLSLVTPLTGGQQDVWVNLSTNDSTDIVLFYKRLDIG